MREGVGVYSSHASVVTFDYGERQDADRDSCSCVTKTSLHCMLHPAHMCVCVRLHVSPRACCNNFVYMQFLYRLQS